MNAHRLTTVLVVLAPVACAGGRSSAPPPPPGADQADATTPAPPVDTEPGSLDFTRVFLVGRGADYWQVEHGIELPQPVREQLEDGMDGVERKFDPSAHGVTSPFVEGDVAVLVGEHAMWQGRVTGLGAWAGGGSDWLLGVLEEVTPPERAPEPDGRLLAVFGPPPQAAARLRRPTAVPLGPRVEPALAEARQQLPALVSDAPEDLISDEDSLDPTQLRLDAGCAATYAPALPPGFDQLLVVNCTVEEPRTSVAVIPLPEPAVSGLVLVGARSQVLTEWNLVTPTLEVEALVDLDGDGVDELLVVEGGHEWDSVSLWHWDGERYVRERIVHDFL